MGMTIKEIIDGLQFTIDMFLFNPSTGEIQPKHLLNEDSRLTVDACEGAIEIMRKYQELEQEPTTKNDLGVDLISRADLLQILWEYDYTNPNALMLKEIMELPSVTPQEPKTGHWVHGEYCSVCGCDVPAYIVDWKWQKDMDAKYCPNCGAKMFEPQESEIEE